MTVKEHQVGQLYTVAKQSIEESDGSKAVEILVNEPYDDQEEDDNNNADDSDALFKPSALSTVKRRGQFTHKIYHAASAAPSFLSALLPAPALRIHERAWNAYPYCRTVMSNEYLDHFRVHIETVHRDDHGEAGNVFGLTEGQLAEREVIWLDIADGDGEQAAEYDPRYFVSERTGRGPLGPDWRDTAQPVMCVYKLVIIKVQYWGIQTVAESWGAKVQFVHLPFHKPTRVDTNGHFQEILQAYIL
jgi:hypothetical protein